MNFDELFDSLPDGWLSKEEAKLLWKWVNLVDGSVLEVGCYKGRSTILLAATGRAVCTVDPFNNFDSDDPGGMRIYREFYANVLERGVSIAVTGEGDDGPAPSGVTLWRQRIEDWTPRPIGFAYLDGDHTFDGTVAQVKDALACGASVIAAHDVNDRGEGREVKRACLKLLGPWADRVERLAVWDRRYRRKP